LRWQGHVVKRFKAQAPYQEALLDEFAAQGWSPSEHLQPVQVITADGRALYFLRRGLSSSSIRLIGTCRLLGQKVRVLISNRVPRGLVVRIVWTCPVGDDLIENGGAILADADLPDCRRQAHLNLLIGPFHRTGQMLSAPWQQTLVPVVEEALRGGGSTPMQPGRPVPRQPRPVCRWPVMPLYTVCGEDFARDLKVLIASVMETSGCTKEEAIVSIVYFLVQH
jgi:hypothetical protein